MVLFSLRTVQVGSGFPCSQTDAMGHFWDLGSPSSRGKSWTWPLASWLKQWFPSSHRSHLQYKNLLPASLLNSHRPRIKNPTHCNYEKTMYIWGWKAWPERMANCPPKVCAPLRQSESDTDDWLPGKELHFPALLAARWGYLTSFLPKDCGQKWCCHF